MDYVYCISRRNENAPQTYFGSPYYQALEVTDTTISCNLQQRQRSSQQILDFADYLWMHRSTSVPVRRWNSGKSFSSKKPLWVQLSNAKKFFDYFKDKFEYDDVMLIWSDDFKPYQRQQIQDIKEFCSEKKWRCAYKLSVTGSEASVTIMYGFDIYNIEFFTRAKTQLVIVTIDGMQR